MKIEMSIRKTEGIIDGTARLWGISIHKDGFEKRLEYPGKIGKGSIRFLELRPGLKIEICDFQPHENITNNFDIDYSLLRFTFFLTGPRSLQWSAGRGKGKQYTVTDFSYRGVICFYTKMRGVMRFSGGQRVLKTEIGISPSLLKTFLGDQFAHIPANLRGIVEGSDGLYHPGIMSLSMQRAVHELLNCPYHGLIKRMYLESKAMELITHQLAQVVSVEGSQKKLLALRPDDVERIDHAREIISRDLENPPTLFDLAKLVGLSHTRLNHGFRKIYGTTVFGYLHRIRLERAKLLLEEQTMNVTEAAFAVGYSSLPSFSRAFSRYFGLKPITCNNSHQHSGESRNP
jgi:AraC-like DNA-binding protein